MAIKSNEIAMSSLIKKRLGDKFCWLCSNIADYAATSLRGDVLYICSEHDLESMQFATLTDLSELDAMQDNPDYELTLSSDIIDRDYENRCAVRRKLANRCITCGR